MSKIDRTEQATEIMLELDGYVLSRQLGNFRKLLKSSKTVLNNCCSGDSFLESQYNALLRKALETFLQTK